MTQRSTSLDQVVQLLIDKRMVDTHTAIPGTIVKWDATEQIADIRPDIKTPLELVDQTNTDGEPVFFDSEEMPVLVDVPVKFARAQSHFVSLPIAKGDRVLVIFCERDISTWYGDKTQKPVDPDDIATHNAGGAIAIAGLYPKSLKLSDVSTSTIRIGQDGGAWDFVALAQKVDDAISALKTYADGIKSAISAGTPTPNDGGAAMRTAQVAAMPSSPSITSVAASDVEVT